MRLSLLLLSAVWIARAACVVENIEPGASGNGTLATECRMRDFDATSTSTSYAAIYRMRVTGPAVFTFRETSTEFNTYLYLYSSAGRVITANDDADGETNSRLTISLSPGVYLLVASSRSVAVGNFKLSTSLEELRSCPIVDLDGDAALSGSFTPASCRALDLRQPSVDVRAVDRYRVKLARRGVLNFTMLSNDFDTYLELRDEQGSRLFSDHAGAGPRQSRLLASLEPGTYVIYAFAYRAASGGYSVTSSIGAPRTCGIKDITPGEAQSGSFSDQSCRYLDLVTPSDDATYVEQYRLRLAKPSVVTFAEQSSVVDSYLIVTDTDLESIFENNDADELTADASIVGSLPAGTYLVLASEADPAAGSFSLSVKTEDPRPCPVQNLEPGTPVSGTFTPTSCRWLDLVMPAEDVTYVAPYRVSLARRSVLTVDMKSPSLDTYLALTTPAYKVVFTNDDADDNTTDSRIVGSLEPGTYLILATMYEADTGNFTLSASAEELRTCSVKDIGRGDSASGTLTDASCRYLDIIVPSDDPTPLDLYRLTAEARGVLTLDLAAKGFTPYLMLTDPEYESYYEDSGESSVKVDLLVLPGSYFIAVNSLDRGGDYTLKTQFAPPRECPASSIGAQDQQAGALSATGCRFSDLVPFTTLDVPTNMHRLTIPQRGAFTARVTSSEFAPALFISDDSNVRVAAYDLNLTGATSAQASTTLPAGTYNLLIVSTSGATGAYQTTTSLDRASGAQSIGKPVRRDLRSILK